jgi:thiol:disulfide interchange protein/DsbC/DsbD-like thiol-disulfide interchange protein
MLMEHTLRKYLKIPLFLFGLFLFSSLCTSAPLSATTRIEQPHVIAELLSEHEGVTAGIDHSFALKLTIDPKWHVYWKYAGDSGSAPKLYWSVNGSSIDANIQWPAPERLPVGPLVNYGYSSEVLLISNLPIPPDVTEKISVSLDAEWLVCKEECIPGNGFFEIELPVIEEELPSRSPSAALFDSYREKHPTSGADLKISIQDQDPESLLVRFKNLSNVEELTFFPDSSGTIINSAPQTYAVVDDDILLSLKRPQNLPAPRDLSGVITKRPAFQDGSSAKQISVSLKELTTPLAPDEKNEITTFFWILLAAFLGGMILNLMPCVFPVLSIKILSFMKKAGKDPRQVQRHGLAFGGGILVSFWVLALLIRILREAGEKLGWGFQLQNPTFVACLVLLLIAVAMNLFGVFEFGSSIQRISGSLDKDGETYGNSFLSGILATVLATPCTAPFMGGAVAYGIQASLPTSILVFTLLALGLATPYLVLSYHPRLLSALPKPGAWMETFKELMGFPVLLTALWLLWVFDKQSSHDSLLALLLAMILFAFALWIYGKLCPPTASRKREIGGMIFLISALAFCLWIGLPTRTPPVPIERLAEAVSPTAPQSKVDAPSPKEADRYGQQWYHYTPTIVKTLQEAGRPVYVDFTAAWCITCQVNKRVVFGSEKVRQTLKAKNVALVKGDWTNEDPVITEALQEFDRLGVPLNVLYSPDTTEDPVIFPSVLTAQRVLDELERLSSS